MTDSTLSNNTAVWGGGGGGLTAYNATVNILRSSLIGNSGNNGAAAYLDQSTATIDSSTITGNIGYHNGIYQTWGGHVTVSSSTFSGNNCEMGIGLIQNSTFAENANVNGTHVGDTSVTLYSDLFTGYAHSPPFTLVRFTQRIVYLKPRPPITKTGLSISMAKTTSSASPQS